MLFKPRIFHKRIREQFIAGQLWLILAQILLQIYNMWTYLLYTQRSHNANGNTFGRSTPLPCPVEHEYESMAHAIHISMLMNTQQSNIFVSFTRSWTENAILHSFRCNWNALNEYWFITLSFIIEANGFSAFSNTPIDMCGILMAEWVLLSTIQATLLCTENRERKELWHTDDKSDIKQKIVLLWIVFLMWISYTQM